MKKLLILSVTALSTSAFATPVTTDTINFAGEVYGQTCTLDKATTTPTKVDLEKIKVSELATSNYKKDFSVKFKECDVKSTQGILVSFNTEHNTITDAGNLKNTLINTSTASTGVGFKLFQENGTEINLKNPDSAKSPVVIQRNLQGTNGAVEFKFKVGYVVEAGAVATTGKITSSIPVTLQYQ